MKDLKEIIMNNLEWILENEFIYFLQAIIILALGMGFIMLFNIKYLIESSITDNYLANGSKIRLSINILKLIFIIVILLIINISVLSLILNKILT